MDVKEKNNIIEENLVQGNDGLYEVVIGLEVHAQVLSNSKLFSGAGTTYNAPPNSQVALVDVAFPGMLPVINEQCVNQAIKTGLGMKAKVNKWSRFDRKNYFYPDLPQGYQISQFQFPIIGEGVLEIETKFGLKNIGIERLHLEQDAGKLIHDIAPDASYLDLNRAGVALMEIVSMPDMRSGEEAAAYFSKLRLLLRYLGTCDGNMEQGSMRADVNVSVRKVGDPLGTRTETKNVNSIRFMKQAISYEVARQIELIESGGQVVQETRLYDPQKGETRSMRSKEDAHDYRYFPCPDLLPLVLSEERIEKIKKTLPELPDDKKHRFEKEYSLSSYEATLLSQDIEQADYFEQVALKSNPKLASNWVATELLAFLKKYDQEISDCKVSAANLASLINMITDNVISGKIAKEVFAIIFETGEDAQKVVEEKGLKQLSNSDEMLDVIKEIIAENPKQVEQVKLKPKTLGWFVGQVMQKTGGKANPAMVNELLKKELDIE